MAMDSREDGIKVVASANWLTTNMTFVNVFRKFYCNTREDWHRRVLQRMVEMCNLQYFHDRNAISMKVDEGPYASITLRISLRTLKDLNRLKLTHPTISESMIAITYTATDWDGSEVVHRDGMFIAWYASSVAPKDQLPYTSGTAIFYNDVPKYLDPERMYVD